MYILDLENINELKYLLVSTLSFIKRLVVYTCLLIY